MNKVLIFCILTSFIVYISSVAGKFLADMESDGSDHAFAETESYEYAGGTEKSKESSEDFYGNPFEGTSWNNNANFSNTRSQRRTRESYTPATSSYNFKGFIPSANKHSNSGGGGGGTAGIVMQSSSGQGSNESMNFGGGYSNPFGGLVAQLSRVAASEASVTNSNPTGTFGLRLGNFEDDQGMKLGSTEPHTAPLDSGAAFVLTLGITAALITLYKKRIQVC